MSKIDINSDQWCDLVFENRNTEFGAFVLRKDSYKRHFKALIIATIIFLFGILAPILVKKVIEANKEKIEVGPTVMVDYKAPEKKVEKKIEVPVEQQKVEMKKTIQFVVPKVVEDSKVKPEDEIQPTVALNENKTQIGAVTNTEGSDTGEMPTAPTNEIAGPAAPDPIIEVPQQQAQYPGGMTALYDYLSSAIQYPSAAKEAGIQGRVILSFVVGKDGRIADIQVLKSLDSALDEEAIRVVKAMPAWSPGRQGDAPVRSRMTLPIVFRLSE